MQANNLLPPLLGAASPLSFLALAGGDNIGRAILYVLCLILSVAVHEFGHAFVADRLGDPLPRQQGRVTLNPLAHIDIFGTVLFPLISALTGASILGWGKPVEWTGHPRYLTRRFSLRVSKLLVSVAGPAMNLLLGLLLSIPLVLVGRSNPDLTQILAYLIAMNFGLMFFNLLPIPPLDGRSFLHFLPESMAPIREALFQYGFMIFMALILLPGGILRMIMSPFYALINLYLQTILGLAGLIG